jgi:rod shape-determining protein MreD
MIRTALNNFLVAAGIIVIQILILNNINLGGYVNPYFYIVFFIILSFDVPAVLIQLIAFAVGFIIDVVAGTLGMHTAACVLIGFVRPFLLKAIAPRDGYDADDKPSIKQMGFVWFFKYTVIMTVIHHTALFFVESFNFVNFWHTLVRIILSSIFTIVLIILSQYFRINKLID